ATIRRCTLTWTLQGRVTRALRYDARGRRSTGHAHWITARTGLAGGIPSVLGLDRVDRRPSTISLDPISATAAEHPVRRWPRLWSAKGAARGRGANQGLCGPAWARVP